MLTDWALVRRAGAELESRLRGSRVQDAGLLPDGRPALLLWSRGSTTLLCIDAFGSPPLVTLETGELAIANEPGFTRALARTLRGMALFSARAMEGERLLRLTFGIRSRFGVGDEVDLCLELVPRFGNAVLVKGDRVVSAFKEFGFAQNPARAVAAGLTYEPPPRAPNAPALPRLIAESGADAAQALAFLESDDALREPLYVYRREGRLVQAHLLPLPAFADAALSREPSLIDLFAEDRANRIGAGERARTAQRRAALLRRIETRASAIEHERVALASRKLQAGERTHLREEGDRIYATLHELDEGLRDEAKDRAAKLFARYRKLGSSLPHVAKRERLLAAQREGIEALAWEAERAGNDELADVEKALDAIDPRRRSRDKPSKAPQRRRKPLEWRTPGGSRILVGRSPLENADLTFRVARPNDLWFHARGVPGAHVILQRDDRAPAPEEDVAYAASLAAAHSKARESGSVPVDYTPRKHVRKQPAAAPGLVFYTEAKTITVAPAVL